MSGQNYAHFQNWELVLHSLEALRASNYAFLNSNGDGSMLLAVGMKDNETNAIPDDSAESWWFGYVGYDVKNQFESLRSNNKGVHNWPDVAFFQPDVVIESNSVTGEFLVHGDGQIWEEVIRQANQLSSNGSNDEPVQGLSLQPDLTQEEYCAAIAQLHDEIQFGNIYEVNYCVNFQTQGEIDPVNTYWSLNALTKAPFSACYKLGDRYILSASPERFLKREAGRMVSQPIKGTKRRGASEQEDLELVESLKNDQKEVSENVMIVDLVRNDLSRVAKLGSVQVDELCGVYTYETVHQMISTISCEDDGRSLIEILRATFPMGSMTGAPKVKAMELIEEHEEFRRGAYSGGLGYVKPNGDFDFNVVIRSILYDSNTKVINAPAGSAITAEADAIKEYEECLLKARAMQDALK